MDPRIIQLLARKLSGEATTEELGELDHLLTHNPEAVYYAELITQLWDEEKIPDIKKTVTDTDLSYLRHLARHRPQFGRRTDPGQPAAQQPPASAPDSAPLPSAEEPPFLQDPSPQPQLFLISGTATDADITAPNSSYDPDLHRRSVLPEVSLPFPPTRRRIPQLAWLLFFLLTGGIFYIALHRHPAGRAADTYAEQYADLGSRKFLTLPDGSYVWLNAGSRIRYDSDMLHKDTRTVTLSGEAFFDVVKDKDRPFIIHTEKIAIKVLGTSFNVRAYPHDRITETTLIGGSIELTVTNKPYQKIVLKPKEKFALIEETHDSLQTGPGQPGSHRRPRFTPERLVVQEVVPVEVEDKEYVKEVSWVDDNFVFQNETLEELAPKMERWFNVHIQVDNARVGNFHYSGIFHKETIDQALTALQLIRPFNFKITDNHVFIH